MNLIGFLKIHCVDMEAIIGLTCKTLAWHVPLEILIIHPYHLSLIPPIFSFHTPMEKMENLMVHLAAHQDQNTKRTILWLIIQPVHLLIMRINPLWVQQLKFLSITAQRI